MPLYEYRCKQCGEQHEEILRVAERLQPAPCKCGGQRELIVSLPANAYISGYPYFDPVFEREVTDPGHRRKLIKQHGLVEKG